MKDMIRKLLALLITVVLVIALFPAAAFAAGNWTDGILYNAGTTFDGGTGTEADPYIIATETSLAQLAVNVNGTGGAAMSYSGVYFKLDGDLDLAGAMWTPIGLWQWSGTNYPFSGNFNGNGHTISNMTVDAPSQLGIGLFGYTVGTLIEDLGIEDCDVSGEALAGGLVGIAEDDSSIHGCYTTGLVAAVNNPAGTGYNGKLAGGLVGIYGNAPDTIDGCWSSATVYGEDGRIGGLVGYSSSGHIKNSYATGDVGGPTGAYTAGGFIGQCDESVIEQCYATGDVTGEGQVGGFVGDASSDDNNLIANCYARGDVISTNEWGWCIGSFAGYTENTDFCNCYGSGSVSYTAPVEAYYIGGFIGDFEPNVTFTSCFFDQTAAGREAVGNDADEGSHAQAGITGLTTANMQGYDTLTNAVKMDALDSGAGAPVSGVPIWYPHSADYPDFKSENCTVTYDSQGADTAASPASKTVLLGETVGALPSDPVRDGCDFGGWWTEVLGQGTEFTDSTPVFGTMTVYALWTKESSVSIYVNGRTTLAPMGTAGIWWYDDDYVDLTENSDGTATIKGKNAGTTLVIYATDDMVELFNVTVRASELPSTGQNGTWIWMLGGAGILALATAFTIKKASVK